MTREALAHDLEKCDRFSEKIVRRERLRLGEGWPRQIPVRLPKASIDFGGAAAHKPSHSHDPSGLEDPISSSGSTR